MDGEQPSDNTEKVYVGIGSNLGDRHRSIARSIELVGNRKSISVEAYTPSVETEPWGPVEQPPFINAVMCVVTELSPIALLKELKKVEATLGRVPGGERWGPREIDLDILLFGNRVVEIPELKIPHPGIVERDFVLKHLVELQRDIVNPCNNKKYSEYL